MRSIAPESAWPSVSVIMPCFNAEHFIADALNSILAQQYPGPLEIVVVDDGSTDKSVQLASAFERVTVIRQENKGPAAARNLALENTSGDVLAFLDADDLWTPGSLQSRVEHLIKDPEVGVVFGDFSYWTPVATTKEAASEVRCQLPDSVLSATREGWVYPEILLDPIVHIIATIVRRSVVDAIGGFDKSLRTGEDYDFFIRAARHCRFSHVESVVARYRLHPSSITRVPQPVSNEYTVVSRAIARYGNTNPAGRQLAVSQLKLRMHKMCFDHALQHLRHGDPRIAASGFRTAIKHHPWRLKPWLFAAAASLKSALSRLPSLPARRP
ncbi:glycosyltransferase [Roseateles sp.]|uniref:glycosyltransferase n=1 Tax=Roseateles sp. TaxID=1971397 RepID=UPI003BA50E0F